MAEIRTTEAYFNSQLRRWVARWRTVIGQVQVEYFLDKAEAEDFARDTRNYTLADSQRVLSGRP